MSSDARRTSAGDPRSPAGAAFRSYDILQTRVSSAFAFDRLPPATPGDPDLVFTVDAPADRDAAGPIRWFHQDLGPDRLTLEVSCGRSARGYVIRCERLGDFHLSADGRAVRCVPLPESPSAGIEHALLGTVFPLLLNLRGRDGIHASAVVMDGSAIAFSGFSGAGKSTIAAYLEARGCAALSDEYLGIEDSDGEPRALPGLSGIRVRRDSLAALSRFDIGADPAPSTRNGSSGATVAVARPPGPAAPRILKRIYCLPARDGSPRPPGVTIEALDGRDAFLEVFRQMHRLDLDDAAMLARQTDLVSRLVAQGRVKRLTVGSYAGLGELTDLLRADLAAPAVSPQSSHGVSGRFPSRA